MNSKRVTAQQVEVYTRSTTINHFFSKYMVQKSNFVSLNCWCTKQRQMVPDYFS